MAAHSIEDRRGSVEAGLPLFNKQTYATNYTQLIDWARRELLLSNLDSFTAEDVREITTKKKPHWVQSGRWFGLVFESNHFAYIDHVTSKRPESRKRQIMRYRLTPAGEAERARLRNSQ